ncbi:MAG: hypothetical protein HQM16_14110 [Deltaproteobacteria bacterium]|nr:hypothetical protein [Deltaproteobacteria bacterium]
MLKSKIDDIQRGKVFADIQRELTLVRAEKEKVSHELLQAKQVLIEINEGLKS